MRTTSTVATLVLVAAIGNARSEVIDTDVCVYGGTAGGVTAAIEVARQGKSVILLEVGQHIGGMTSGGLGATDIGNKDVIGGLSRDFYRHVAMHYAKDASWTRETREHFFEYRSKRTKLEEVLGEDATMWTFEPHVARQILLKMLSKANVPVLLGQRLNLVKKDDKRIAEIQMDNGASFRAKMFIDATYEGDLMAMSGVSYRVGREANAVYGETLNGIRDETPKNQIYGNVDPYVTPGDSTSGLIPLIQRGSGGIPGDGDHRVQAYNFRLCFTNVVENRRTLQPPTDYDPALYELAARRVEKIVAAGDEPVMKNFCNPVWMPNGKTDINNSQGISTDFIGMNYDYPDADFETRAQIWQAHEDYVRGFWYFMSTSSRVPVKLRNEFLSFGPCKDEFPDTEGWSYQLYVREARRMVSDYVMSEHNCQSKKVAEDSVGMAAYGMDSHNCQRIVQGGVARNEGDVQKHGLKPYPISYRSIIPKATECENLLVPVCVSATHIAFGSIRMEPVFMVLGQSAGNAAALAIDRKIAVQFVDYQQLRSRLLANGQVLGRRAKPKQASMKSKQPEQPLAKPTVVCFGDSVTKRGYPAELANFLNVEVLNSGVAGHTSSQGLRRIERDLLAHEPKVAVILFGTNDLRADSEKKHVPLKEFSKNLDDMAKACSARKICTVFCTVPPIDTEVYFERHKSEAYDKLGGLDAMLKQYREAAIKVALQNEIPVIDLAELLQAEPAWMHRDGVHPSPSGNRIIAQLVAKQVQELIKAGN